MFIIICMLIASTLLAVHTRRSFRSGRPPTPLAANPANLFTNSSKSPVGRIDSRRTQARVLFVAGLSGITNRATKAYTEAILTAFLAKTFGLTNNQSTVIYYLPAGCLQRRSVVVAQVDETTYHHVLLWKHILLRRSPVTIDLPRPAHDLRQRYAA